MSSQGPRKQYATNPPHLAVFAVFLALFGIYQFWDISVHKKGLEASALRGLFGVDAAETEGNFENTSKAASSSNPQNTPEISGETSFDVSALEADAVIVMDAKTGETLYEKNAHDQLPLASLTKVMTALAAEEQFRENEFIEITPEAIQTEGESGFEAGGMWRYRALLDYGLVTSSNDAMVAIAEAFDEKANEEGAFVREMNNKANELNLAQTYFLNPTGLDTNSAMSGGYGSAADMAVLFQNILKQHPDLLEVTSDETVAVTTPEGRDFFGENTNKIISQVPGVIASKTGFTDLAGGNLVMTWNAGVLRPVIIVVLHSTREGRFEDMQKLVNATIRSFGGTI